MPEDEAIARLNQSSPESDPAVRISTSPRAETDSDFSGRFAGLRLLRNRNFATLFSGNLGNAMGIELRTMAQSWLILELGGSQFWVGAAIGLRIIPAVILGLLAGVWIDRVGGRTVLLMERISLLLLAALTAWVVMSGAAQVWHVVVLSVAASALISLGIPAMQSMIRIVVPTGSLQAANSLNQLTFSSARALGPLGGGFLIAAFGLGSPWLALIGLYAMTIALTLRLPEAETKQASGQSVFRQMAEGITYIRRNPVISRIVLLSFTAVLSGTVMPIIPVYARDRFAVGETGFGTMMAAFALGQAAAAAYIVINGGWAKKAPVIQFAALLWVVAMVTFGFSHVYLLSLGMLFLIGVALPLWVTSVVTLLQTQSDGPMLGRVMSIYGLSIQMFFLGALTGAWIGQLIGNDVMLLAHGIVSLVVHGGLLYSSRELRKL